ncbi:MAG: outer membrane lipoprotein-sorting protein [Desulfobacula sp.]|nr:outer membrane lipoprotein-sorting protein [Desulfobacula sp.]
MNALKIIAFTLILLLPVTAVKAQDPLAPAPMDLEKATALLAESDLSRGNSSGLEWDIDIESQTEGDTEANSLTVLVKDTNCLAEYQSPANVKGRKLLMKDRNMWFIKPGLSKPVPISPRQKLLGGSSNGDIASTNYAGDYTIEHFTGEVLDGEPCMVYDLKAKNKNLTYDRIRYWVSQRTKTGVKAEFFTLSGKLFKTAVFEYDHKISLNGQERPFVSKMTITGAVVETEKTVMAYSRIRLRDISPSAFNLDLLVK